jgi:hypothetical protein
MIGRMALILIAVALLVAMLRKLTRPKVGRSKPAPRVATARKCPACGAYVLDDQACTCGRDG